MKIQDKIYLSILFLLVAISFLNVTVNRMVFDRKITSQVMLDEKLVLGIPIPSEKEIKKRALDKTSPLCEPTSIKVELCSKTICMILLV